MNMENTITSDDLLLLLGAKEAQIMALQRHIAGLQQRIESLAKALQEGKEGNKGEGANEPIQFPRKPKKGN